MIVMELSRLQYWFIYIGISAGVIILLAILLFVLFGLRKRREAKPELKIDQEFMVKLIDSLGGKDNIKSYENDNGRVKFSLVDVKLIKQDLIKELSTTGAFIVSNNVKLLFKYDALTVMNNLKEWVDNR